MPLSSLGVAQSALAAVRLASNQTVFCEDMGIVNISAVYTSNMQRAVQTAGILAQQAGLGQVIEDDRLRERSVGEWSGLTYEEVGRRGVCCFLCRCACLDQTCVLVPRTRIPVGEEM